MVPAPMRLEDVLAVLGHLEVQADTRRDALPREEIGARERLARWVRVVVELFLRRCERLAVINTDADVQRRSAEPDAVVDEGADVARSRRVAERLPHLAVPIRQA